MWWALMIGAWSSCASHQSSLQISPQVTVHTFRRDYSNTHVVVSGEHAFLVDAGLESSAPALVEDMRKAGLKPEALDAIILSHGHADHSGGAAYFKRQFGTRLVAGKGDAAMLASGKIEGLCPTDRMARGRVDSDSKIVASPIEADVLIDSVTELKTLLGVPGKVVPLAGHTEGSLVVVLDEAPAVLVGDLFRGAVVGSSAEVHFYMCSLDDNKCDIVNLLQNIAPGAQTFFTGHFGPVDRTQVLRAFLPR
jgi:hydroxyacylglutathione hydrolase